MHRTIGLTMFAATGLLMAGCASQPAPAALSSAPSLPPTQAEADPSQAPAAAPAQPTCIEAGIACIGYTYNSPDGSRYLPVSGQVAGSTPLDIFLSGPPRWIVSAAHPAGGAAWAAAGMDGVLEAFHVVDGQAQPISVQPARLPEGTPPVLLVSPEGAAEVLAPPEGASTLTHPIITVDGQTAYISEDGDLVITSPGAAQVRLPVNAMQDARILQDENGRLLLLSDPTDAYGHGVLGNAIEAASFTLVETQPQPRIALRVDAFDGAVIEGIAPIWADLDGDGDREIIVTLSDAQRGARIAAYNEDGTLLAQSSAIGQGNRWRHQLAVAPFDGTPGLADVLTPHLSRTVEFFTLAGDQLNVTATLPGYTAHLITGGASLDTTAAGDFDGSGQPEILIPTASFDELAGIALVDGQAQAVYTLEVEAGITSNLSAVQTDAGVQVGVGLGDARLRIWQ